jgi:DNA repair protein REV1
MVSPHSPTSSNSSALFGSDDTSFLEALGVAVLPGDVAQNEGARRSPSSPSPILESSSLEPPPCAQPTSNVRARIGSDDEPELLTTSSQSRAGSLPQQPTFVISDDDETCLQLNSPPLAQSRYRKRARSVSSIDEPVHSPTNSPTGISSSYLVSDTYGAARFGEFGEYMRRKRAKLQIQNAEIGDTQRGKASECQIFKGLSIHVGTPATVFLVEALKDVRSTVGQNLLFRSCVS